MFLQDCKVQIRVIHALIFRELRTRFGRQQLGYVWALFEPIMFVVILTAVFSIGARGTPAEGMPIPLFLLTGIVPFLMFRQTMARSLSAIISNRPLLTFPQVTPLDLVIGRAFLETVTLTVVFIVLILAMAFLGWDVNIENPVLVVLYLSSYALMGFGFGAFCGAFSIMFPSIERMVPIMLGRPLFFTSGLFFTVSMMPEAVRPLLLINPLLHSSERLRDAFFVGFSSEYGDVQYIISWVLVDLFLGLVAQRAMRKRILTAAQGA